MSMLGVVGAIAALAGALFFWLVFKHQDVMIIGGLLGFLFVWNIIITRKLGQLTSLLSRLRKDRAVSSPPVAKVDDFPPPTVPGKSVDIPPPTFAVTEEDNGLAAADSLANNQLDFDPEATIADTDMVGQQARTSLSSPTGSWQRARTIIKDFFTHGNVVLRVGLLVLFFGVAFLLKYAAERSLLPIELRLCGVVVAGLFLLVLGWRLRLGRPDFALLSQGGGVGVLFLTIFAAAKLYDLLPLGLSFGLMILLVGLSAALALLQDARSLAFFGAMGGFLAPVLLANGSGNHVALFSYYALLNVGILVIAWFRAWRGLNLLGFVFTLAIGSIWGIESYQPRYFATTEPFLVLFFVMFSLIAVLFATRQPPKLRGYVDGSLVFGTPIICFALQAALVKDMTYGMAISALVGSFFYIILATLLWNRGDDKLRAGMRTMVEAFLALAIVFATLAVPLALSGHWTAVTWAMEGAALVWVGVRQQRLIPRNSGFILQIGASLVFWDNSHAWGHGLVILNGQFLGSLVVCFALLFSSWYLYRAEKLHRYERYHHLILFIWGMFWWFSAGGQEISHHLISRYEGYGFMVFVGLSVWVMLVLVRPLSWPLLGYPSLGLLPLMIIMGLGKMGWHGSLSSHHLLADYGFLAWPLTIVLLYRCLYLAQACLVRRTLRLWHVSAFILMALLVSAELAWQVSSFTYGAGCWSLVIWGLVPMAFVWFSHASLLQRWWPLTLYRQQYQFVGALPLLSWAWLWLVTGSLLAQGNATPLPYLPLFNPLELSQILVMIAMFAWYREQAAQVDSLLAPKIIFMVVGLTLFVWLNGALARAIHQLAGVAFTFEAMMASLLFQVAISILWSLVSLLIMVSAQKLQNRAVWFVGSGLIALTVAKLILIDLAQSGTIERIISFLAVGLLLMVIGYFAPLPPLPRDKSA